MEKTGFFVYVIAASKPFDFLCRIFIKFRLAHLDLKHSLVERRALIVRVDDLLQLALDILDLLLAGILVIREDLRLDHALALAHEHLLHEPVLGKLVLDLL